MKFFCVTGLNASDCRWAYSWLLVFMGVHLSAVAADSVSVAEADSVYLTGAWLSDGAEIRLTRSELSKLPGVRVIEAEIIPGAGAVPLTVLPFAALLEAYPLQDASDGIVLETWNAWESFLTVDYIQEEDTLLLLYYDGLSPEAGQWPYFGGDIEPLAPFYAFDPGEWIPRFTEAPKYGMIAATQIKGLRAVNTAERYAPFFNAPMDQLSSLAIAGRRLFLQRCNACHEGPGGVGGRVSDRPYAVLQAHATYNADYFRRVVRNPKEIFVNTAMPRHEDFEDADYAALIAFLKESSLLMK